MISVTSIVRNEIEMISRSFFGLVWLSYSIVNIFVSKEQSIFLFWCIRENWPQTADIYGLVELSVKRDCRCLVPDFAVLIFMAHT